MEKCEHVGICRFYSKSLPEMPGNSEELIAEYCHGNSLRCARSMIYISMTADSVPDTLMPGDKADAYIVLAGS
jgi:hypothetical protein